MAITYRTTDALKWGTGKSVGLTNTEIDNNFYELATTSSIAVLKTSATTQSIASNISITGNLSVSGTTSSTNFDSISDARFKKDLEKITNALNKIKSLTGYTYTLIETNERSTGLLAQEVELVQPESVGGDENRKTLSYGSMMGLVVEAIKELEARVSEIQNQISNK